MGGGATKLDRPHCLGTLESIIITDVKLSASANRTDFSLGAASLPRNHVLRPAFVSLDRPDAPGF